MSTWCVVTLPDIYLERPPKRKDGWPQWVWVPTESDFVKCEWAKMNGYPRRCAGQMLFFLFGSGPVCYQSGVEVSVTKADLDRDRRLRRAFQVAAFQLKRNRAWWSRVVETSPGVRNLSLLRTRSDRLIDVVMLWNDSEDTTSADQVKLIKGTCRELGYKV